MNQKVLNLHYSYPRLSHHLMTFAGLKLEKLGQKVRKIVKFEN
jgi:hypothetical protein